MPRRFREETIADIYVAAGGRETNEEAVAALAESMAKVGLLTPVAIRYVAGQEVVMEDGEIVDSAPHLVSGLHRLAAARRLGWQAIECEIVEADTRRARMLEIAENLHRAELTKLERSEQTAEWLRLAAQEGEDIHSAQVAPNESKRSDRRGHRPEGGLNAASRELGVERTEAQRATKIDALSPEAKAEAKALGLDDNQSALLSASRAGPAEAQVTALRQHKARPSRTKRRGGAQPPKTTPLQQLIDSLSKISDLEEVDLKQCLALAKSCLRVLGIKPDDLQPRRSRFESWANHVSELRALQDEMRYSLEAMPENFQGGERAERLEAYIEIDLSDLDGP